MSTYGDQLEEIIDRIGVSSTLEMIADICHEKAEHINHNWQDKQLAAEWTRVAKLIGSAMDS